ncbi:MAG TPA: FtsX-like permease family protein [Streptosporangiaceae bacterium]|nr:FtsX-like permease family protein [Streptosporangiaceae bacterium]
MTARALWLRWSWRDLRARWAQVCALALVIALGTGTYAALLSTSAWRTQSNDASFALLHTHDLRVTLAQGSSVPQGSLLALVRRLPHAADVTGARERLIAATQVAGPHGVLVPGEVVGTGTGPGPGVDTVNVAAGRGLPTAGGGAPATGGLPAVVLDRGFAQQNGLPDAGTLRVAGGARVRYTGIGQSPEFFVASGGAGGTPFLSQKIYAVLFTTLATSQRLAGAPGRVNDLVLTLRPGTNRALVQRELRSALAAAAPPVSATVTTRSEMPAYRVLYEDIDTDAQLWRVIALLVLAGAAFAALNLTTRIVEAQRREIGIGMALGVRPALLAVRPLLFAAQVALIGVVFGIGAGYLVGIPLGGAFEGLLPLPVWRSPFQAGTFAQAAAIGFVLPFAAAAWPVWRAVRVQPVEAIRVGSLAARSGGLAPLLSRLPLPGRSYHQMPLRNAARTPRRSALTFLGVAAVIATAVTITGLLDTFRGTLDIAQADLLRSAPDRVIVSLDSYYPVNSRVVAAVRALPEAGRVETDPAIPGTVRSGGRSVAVQATVLAPGASWAPQLTAGHLAGGLVLAQKAASDLRVHVGSRVVIEHPQAAAGGMRTVSTPMTVAGIHSLPLRAFAYLEPAAARAFGLAGTTNELTVQPSAGHSAASLQRALLDVPHVASAQGIQATVDGIRSALNKFTSILNITSVIALLLVLLIAFNTASIGMDERSREHATMIAFGLPVPTVVGMTMAESVLIGTLGALAGVGVGYGLLAWLVATTVPNVAPDIGIALTLAGGTVLAAVLLGAGTVALAPLFTVRRLRRMDVPATLRVVE